MTRGATSAIGRSGFAALLAFVIGLGGCRDSRPAPQPPSVSAVRLSETAVPVLLPGETHILHVAFDYADADSDLASASVAVAEPGGTPLRPRPRSPSAARPPSPPPFSPSRS